MGSRKSTALREVLVVSYFLVLAALALRPLLGDFWGTTLVGPDPLIDLWTVDWISGHLLKPGALYGGNIFAPSPHAVLYSDLSLGTAVLVAPFRVVLRDPVPLYNLALLLALAFGGWSFCALGRTLTGSLPAGLLTGTLAAFSSHQMSHIYHLNLLTIGWLGLFLLGLQNLLSTPGLPTLLLLGGSFALTAESSGYYAVGAVVLALLFALVERLRGRRALGVALGGAFLGVLLMLPYLKAYQEVRSEDQLRRPIGMSEKMAFHPTRDLSSVGYLDGTLLGSSGERLFPGFLTLALALCALACRAKKTLFPAVGAFLCLLLSLGPFLRVGGLGIRLPYAWLAALPALNGMRHPYTFASLGVFLLAVLAGQGLAAVPFLRRTVPSVLVLGLAVLETLAPPPAVGPVPRGIPPVYTLVFSHEPGVILEIPPFEPQTLLWAARHSRRVANGAGAFVPVRTLLLERYVQNHWLQSVPPSIDLSPPTDLLLREFDVRYLVLPVGRRPALSSLSRAFKASRVFSLLGTAEDGDEVYEIDRFSAHPGEGGEQPGEVSGQDREAVRQ
jgi:hypothetical protein